MFSIRHKAYSAGKDPQRGYKSWVKNSTAERLLVKRDEGLQAFTTVFTIYGVNIRPKKRHYKCNSSWH